MSEKESLAYPDAKKEVAEKVEEKESNTMEKEVEAVASDSVSNQNQNSNNENQHQNPLTEPSSSTITFHSPSPPSSSLRTRKSPSPPLHSISDSSISSGHSSTGHVSSSPSPPRKSPAVSSPESSISDGHFSLRDEATPIEDQRFPPVPAPVPVVVAHRFQVEPNVVTRVDPGAEEGFIGVNDVKQASAGDGNGNGGGGGGGGTNRRLRPDVMSMLRSKKIAMWSKVLLSLRIATFASCLMSLSVLAADKRKGWAQDSFYRYKEFRYSLSVNAIGFMYSALQICDLVKYIFTRKHIVEHQLRALFSFVMDQILTYLLMSASSSAATRAYDWESNWGKDKFPDMANASVVLSFVAFVAFAFTSLVSGSILCRFR